MTYPIPDEALANHTPLIVLTAPVWLLLIGALWLLVGAENFLDPPGWRRVFAWWPAECDPWPDEGYRGWVWLETIWRNPTRSSGAWSKFRREAPAESAASPPLRAAKSESEEGH